MRGIAKILILFTLVHPIIVTRLPIEPQELIIVVLCLFFAVRYLTITKEALIVLLGLFAMGTAQVIAGNNTAFLFGKIYISISAAILFSFYVVRFFKYDLRGIIRLYITGVLIVCGFGIIQFISSLIGFSPGYDFTWFFPSHNYVFENGMLRINSYYSEPSIIAQSLSPAFFLSLCRVLSIKPFFVKRWEAFVIIFIYVFSLSSLAFIAIFFSILLLGLHYLSLKRIIYIGLLIGISVPVLLANMHGLKKRVGSALIILKNDDLTGKNHSIDASTFTLYNNLMVAKENISRHPFTGTGLGSHQIAFFKYSLTRTNPLFAHMPEYNYNDAGSLFVRVLSEMGVIGMFFYIIFLFFNFVKRSKKYSTNEYWIISTACLLIVLVSFVRKGHYFNYGILLFMVMYYYNHKNFKIFKKELQEKQRLLIA